MVKFGNFKKGLAVVLSAAMLAGLMPGMGTMQVSATEEGGSTESTGGVSFTPISGTQGAGAAEDYGMLIDGKYSNSKWCVTNFSGAYIIFSASEAGYVTGYSITTGNDNASEHGRNPKDWKLYGCNDPSADRDSTSWVEIHSIKNDKVLQDENYKTYNYELDSLTAEKYQYFKLEIMANQGASIMQMSEFALKYSSCDHQWRDAGEVVAATCRQRGYKVQQCSECNETAKLYTQGALGHYFVDGQCSRCDAGHNKKVNYLDESGESKEATCYVISEITDSLTGTDEQPGWYVAEDDVTIDQRITINGNVHLVLADNSSLRVNGGITLVVENKLSIYAQSQGSNMGSLVADNVTEYCAGIGGEKDSAGGIINIAGGNVTACGGYQGSGIGGGLGGLGGTVTITGGNVTACGGYEGSGIGGGVGNHGGNVTITGGNVTANGGGEYGAGIGGGDYGSGGTVIISGGIVRVSNIGRGSYKAETDGTFATQSESAPDGKAIIIAGSIGDGSGKETDWRGFIFDGNSGKVYGESFTFTQDFTMDGGKTLTIDSGKSLIIDSGSTFTVPYSAKIYNNGTCKVGGTVCNFSDTDMNATVENGGKIHQDINHDGICDKCNESDNCAIFNNVTVGSYEDFMQGSLNENITLTAPVTPNDENDTVTYKWYEKSEDGTYKSIWKATGSSYVVKKTTHGGKYEYRMEALCEGVVRWIPFVVEVACAEYENGFCTTCGAYQPASLTTDKHDVDGDDKCDAVYEIANTGQLYWFADKVNNYNGKFGSANAILMDNITVNTGDVAGCNGTKAEGWRDWTPIGNETYQYTGTFDGKNHTISGLYCCDDETIQIGLFGYLGKQGRLCNVGGCGFLFQWDV